ncbi:hypothetical protein BRAS3843_190025 [Bradyrhizobium sp. STM 3843]|nr:hypothetical protein BRAS3843_190025 [Bradyrhizobium sp. STM 3843]
MARISSTNALRAFALLQRNDVAAHLVAVATKFVAVLVFVANLDAAIGSIFIKVPRAAIRIFVAALHSPVLTGGATIHILIHHTAHAVLAHAIHAHAILITLLRRPVSVDPRVFGTLTVSLARLI